MKRILILLGCLIALIAYASAQDTLAQAEALYRQGKFSAALGMYEQALKNHPKDAFVYYNIGNCYFKMGSKGLAIANYYRAFRLDPRDADIRHNLTLALSGSGERFVPNGMPVVMHKLFFGLSLAELTGAVSMLFWIFCFLLCFWLLKRKAGKLVLLSAVVLCICAGWWYLRLEQEQQPLAVIASPAAEVRSGPGTNFPASASISQGHLVVIKDAKDSWYEVVVQAQGLKGWIEKDVLERI